MQNCSTSDSHQIQNILKTMAYNEEQVHDFSSILNWLTPQKNNLTSIVNGEWTRQTLFKEDNSFSVGKTKVGLGFASADLLEKTLSCNDESKKLKETLYSTLSETESQSRLLKLKNLMEKIRLDLRLCESIATEIPTWQIVEYDEPSWNHQMSCSTNESHVMYLPRNQVIQQQQQRNQDQEHKTKDDQELEGKAVVLVVDVSRQGYSLEKILSTILIPAIQFDGKFILTMSLSSAQDSSCTLPIAYLIDAVNKSKIRKEPIDLLLLDRSCEKSMGVLKRKSTSCKIHVGGDVETSYHLPLHLLSGVFGPTKGTGGAHFIVDSSADVQTAVEAISVNVWTLGTKVNGRARSLLFVHQAVHKVVIESVMKKMTQLKTGKDLSLKMVDFIKRSNPSILPQGVKVFPQDSDLTVPTLVYEMGTSCDLIASPQPGYGHVLVVIPYRNTSELVSLSNNFDHQNQVFIYTSNLTFFKRVTTQLNANDVWANTSQANTNTSLETFINYSLVREDETQEKIPLATVDLDKLNKIQNGAEKSLKSWSSTPILKRFDKLKLVLSSLLKRREDLSEEDKVDYFTNLLKTVNFNSNNLNGNNLKLESISCQPFGSMGIILVGPEKLNFLSRIMTILVAALKGNVCTVLYVPLTSCDGSHGEGEEDWKIVQNSFDSFLPPGVVNFIRFPGLNQAVQASSLRYSKFNLVWMIHDGDGVALDQVLGNAFNRLLLDTQFTNFDSLLLQAQHLEIVRTIHV